MAMCAPSRRSPATRTCVPSTATATTARTSPAKSQPSLPKSETGCLLAPKLRRAGEINPFVGQRRCLSGLGTGLGEDAVDRALADLEGSGNLGPGRPAPASSITSGALARACGGCPLYLPSALA